jgi:hypothetical protein
MDNQRGEVILGAMILMMGAIMLFGGMHVVHGGHRCGGAQPQNEAQQDRLDEDSQHVHGSAGAQAIAPAPEDAR